jgi:hypothetical protein
VRVSKERAARSGRPMVRDAPAALLTMRPIEQRDPLPRPRDIKVIANATAGRSSIALDSRVGAAVSKERDDVLSDNACRLLSQLRVCGGRSGGERPGSWRWRRWTGGFGAAIAPAGAGDDQSADTRPERDAIASAAVSSSRQASPCEASAAVHVRRALCHRRRFRRAADGVCAKRWRPAGSAGHHQPAAVFCAAAYRSGRSDRRDAHRHRDALLLTTLTASAGCRASSRSSRCRRAARRSTWRIPWRRRAPASAPSG